MKLISTLIAFFAVIGSSLMSCGLPVETHEAGMAPIRESWDRFFAENALGYFLQVSHREGAMNVQRVLEKYHPERGCRITILALSPTTYIDRYLCEKVVHIIDEKDPPICRRAKRMANNQVDEDVTMKFIKKFIKLHGMN